MPTHGALAVGIMVCARCGEWIENQWLFWMFWPPHIFLPPDIQFITPVGILGASGVAYFFCARCTVAKYENEGWTPGTYLNEHGDVSTDDEDEYFVYQQLTYCRAVVDG